MEVYNKILIVAKECFWKMHCFLQFPCPILKKSKKNNKQSHKSEEQTKVPGIDKSTRS